MRDETSLPHKDYITQAFDDNREMIDRIVIHSTVCTTQEAINTFSSPTATTSAHYIVGNDGSLWSGLEEWLVAYHSGNYAMNQRSIGIENEWYPGIHPTDALYKTLASLVKDICQFHNLPIDATTIIPHKQVVATSCPNEIDVNRVIREAQGGSAPVDECPAKLLQITAERDRLNGVITGKDIQILNLNNTIISKDKELLLVAEQLKVCQSGQDSILELKAKLDKLQAKYDKLKATPSKAQLSILFSIAEKLGVQL